MIVPSASHFGTDWSDQWARVQRWHSRVMGIRDRLPADGEQKTRALDDLFAFFMNCYQLSDWLERSHPRSKDVREFVRRDDALSLCRSVCNGLKHFRLENRSRDWSTATRHPVYYSGPDGAGAFEPPGVAWVFVEATGGEVDMFKHADDCIGAWKRFLAETPQAG